MSTTVESKAEEEQEDALETLYNVHEDLQVIADSDAEWAKYAEKGLEKLREAGYDV